MTQLLEWRFVADLNFPMDPRHRMHQRLMHVQANAKVQRRLAHRDKQWNKPRKYSGNLY